MLIGLKERYVLKSFILRKVVNYTELSKIESYQSTIKLHAMVDNDLVMYSEE